MTSFESDNATAKREDAWERIDDATPAGWFVGLPSVAPGRVMPWSQYAFDRSERAVIGQRQREISAVGDTEIDVLERMSERLEQAKNARMP